MEAAQSMGGDNPNNLEADASTNLMGHESTDPYGFMNQDEDDESAGGEDF